MTASQGRASIATATRVTVTLPPYVQSLSPESWAGVNPAEPIPRLSSATSLRIGIHRAVQKTGNAARTAGLAGLDDDTKYDTIITMSKPTIKHVLLLPLTYNPSPGTKGKGSPVPQEAIQAILDEIYVFAGGYTVAGTVKGAYRMRNGADRMTNRWKSGAASLKKRYPI